MMASSDFSNARRGLPSLDRLLSHPAVASLISLYGRDQVRVQARRVVDELRERLAADPPPAAMAAESAVAALPSLAELVEQGVDLACGSGDKLLGGPQAGLLVGRIAQLARCRRHPLYRALRPDRTALAALEGVLRLHLAGAPLPVDRRWPAAAAHRARLELAATPLGAEIVPGEALALPGDDALLARLRRGDPPVVGYLRQGRLILDLRTVAPEDDEALIATVRIALQNPKSKIQNA
jgi:L-seryl-tRNA(Ser) seleniumtransferase